jgi:tetratricopeptide (TPR) repeat protein
MDRLETLKELVRQNPSGTFARYGLAMEYARAGEFEASAAEYKGIVDANPEYAAAYYQGGKVLERLGRLEEAREFYRMGIEVTTRLGDAHARDELQGALELLG